MQGNILLAYSVILPLEVKVPSVLTSVSAFHVQGNIISGFYGSPGGTSNFTTSSFQLITSNFQHLTSDF